jgi:enoyl-CoA hydratase/carnithine racemase
MSNIQAGQMPIGGAVLGDHWDAQTAYRMGVVQEIAPNEDAALKIGIDIANRIAACGPIALRPRCKRRIWRSMIRRIPLLSQNWRDT